MPNIPLRDSVLINALAPNVPEDLLNAAIFSQSQSLRPALQTDRYSPQFECAPGLHSMEHSVRTSDRLNGHFAVARYGGKSDFSRSLFSLFLGHCVAAPTLTYPCC